MENRLSYGYSFTTVKLKLKFVVSKCRQLKIRDLLNLKQRCGCFVFILDYVPMCLSLCGDVHMSAMPEEVRRGPQILWSWS